MPRPSPSVETMSLAASSRAFFSASMRSRHFWADSSALSKTFCGSLIMSPGSGSSVRVLSAMRPAALSWSTTMHLMCMPGWSTALRSVMRSYEIWEMWRSAEMPFTSTKAPYGLMARTSPSRRSPRPTAAICSSRMARRLDTTSLPTSASTWRNLTRKVLPTSSSLSSVARWEPGRKPRMPSMSQMQPPRLVASTVASMTTSSAWSCTTLSHAWRYSICLMDTRSWPLTWSSPITSNSRSSPTATTSVMAPTARRPASLRVMIAVDLAPISMSAPSLSICTTLPCTRSPRTKRRRVESKMPSKSS
mmetsp:Transcript_14507/g.43602  ORF Transcript_14507/g.43602 Transcript_14507/m.43602 type:complete len:305 (+) Transcript_14507:1007-1921(+)